MEKKNFISEDKFMTTYPSLYGEFYGTEEVSKILRESYEKALECLSKNSDGGNRAAIFLPTGTGKSKIYQALIIRGNYPKIADENQRRVVVVAPTNAINGQCMNWLETNNIESVVKVITYSYLNSIVKSKKFTEFFKTVDFIIFDEMHHMGAKEWEKSIRTVLNTYPDIDVLGMTATQYRYLDCGRDMAEEFNMDVIINKSVTDFWDKKIMKAPNYIVLDEKLNEYIAGLLNDSSNILNKGNNDSKVAKAKVEAILNGLNGDCEVSKTLHDQVYAKGVKKLMVFHSTIDETDQVMESIGKYLTEAGYEKIRFFVANTGVNYSKKTIQDFCLENKTDELWVLLSIDMCGEGMHIDGVFAEVFLRHTYSRNIFLQQLGRIMSVNPDAPKPIVIDFVNNLIDSAVVGDTNNDNYFKDLFNFAGIDEEESDTDDSKKTSSDDYKFNLVGTKLIDFIEVYKGLEKKLSKDILQAKLDHIHMIYAEKYSKGVTGLELLKY